MIKYTLVALSIIITSCMKPGSGSDNSGNNNSNSNNNNNNKECAQLDSANCKDIGNKICKNINNQCSEIKTCADLTTLGQSECKDFAAHKCLWLSNKCLNKSSLINDFQSTAKTFHQATDVGHSEIADTFMHLTSATAYSYEDIKFEFIANKNEVDFNVKISTGAKTWGTAYKFTYQAADLDNDTMLITLTGTKPHKTGLVFGTANVDVVEPFERAIIMYQKSTNKLFFLIVYKQSDMANFKIDKPSDFIIPAGTDIKDRSEPHAALIMTI